jgi:hypothetical protein
VLDPLGARQTYERSAVKVKVEDPLAAHFEQLGKYTDADMHNVATAFAVISTVLCLFESMQWAAWYK